MVTRPPYLQEVRALLLRSPASGWHVCGGTESDVPCALDCKHEGKKGNGVAESSAAYPNKSLEILTPDTKVSNSRVIFKEL